MLKSIFLNIPFIIFFLYALNVCREKKTIAPQPATLAFYLYLYLLANIFVTLTIQFILVRTEWRLNTQPIFTGLAALHTLVNFTLLVCVFAWRNTPESTYRRPAILAGIAVVMELALFVFNQSIRGMLLHGSRHESMETLMAFSSVVNFLLNLSSYIFVFTALFDGRGYPKTKKDRITAALGIPADKPAGTPVTVNGAAAVPAQGIFEERDFIPFVIGIMLLGGLLVVPVLWGQFSHLEYKDALFPSLLSCGIFAFSHDKRGNFLWGRFIMLLAVIVVTAMRSSLRYGGRPMFLAGGILGYVVMFGCGWIGIALARLVRGKST